MARVVKLEIENFRSIRSLAWLPQRGFNCLIGPGDSGKSTILDAIAWCLTYNPRLEVTDADFYRLEATQPIKIIVTLLDLPDRLGSLEPFGPFQGGFNPQTQEFEDEPGAGLETTLTVSLFIDESMQGQWSLESSRELDDHLRRVMAKRALSELAILQMHGAGSQHLRFGQGSVLFKLTDEILELSGSLAASSRQARATFGESAHLQLQDTLKVVSNTAREFGVGAVQNASATIDSSQVILRPSHIALGDVHNVPLSRLGLGSSRILIAGLRKTKAGVVDVGLVDEIEQGLEPHRVIRLLQALDAKLAKPQLQVFATTHSSVVIRELEAHQLARVLNNDGKLSIPLIDPNGLLPGALRLYPEAFLAKSIIVCEGASEVGLLRGIDNHRQSQGLRALSALGVALVDANGVNNIYNRAHAFQALGYRVAVLRDDDKQPKAEDEAAFRKDDGALFHWRMGYAIEDALFHGMDNTGVKQLVSLAVEIHTDELVCAQLESAREPEDMDPVYISETDQINLREREICARAAKSKTNPWLKSVGRMEKAAKDVVALRLAQATDEFQTTVNQVFEWAESGNECA